MDDDISREETNKVDEYFRLKKVLKTLKADLKDQKEKHPEIAELNKLTKKAKELREKIADDETIKELGEKVGNVKERLELVKEIIRVELLESAREEVKRDGKKLKLVYVLKELRDDGSEEARP